MNTLQWGIWPVGSFRCCWQHRRIKPVDFIVSLLLFASTWGTALCCSLVVSLWVQKHRATKCCTQSVFSQDILTYRCDSFLMTWDIMTGCGWQIWLCGEIAHFCMDSRAWGAMRFCCNCQMTESEFGSLLHIMSFPISHVNRRSWHVGNAYHFYWKYSNSQAVWLRYPLNCSVCLVYSPVHFEQFHFWFCRTSWQ